jgi:hypothetical protein
LRKREELSTAECLNSKNEDKTESRTTVSPRFQTKAELIIEVRDRAEGRERNKPGVGREKTTKTRKEHMDRKDHVLATELKKDENQQKSEDQRQRPKDTRRARRTTKTKNGSKSLNCPPEATKSRHEETEICSDSKRAPIGRRNSVARLLCHRRIWIERRNFIWTKLYCNETSWADVEP